MRILNGLRKLIEIMGPVGKGISLETSTKNIFEEARTVAEAEGIDVDQLKTEAILYYLGVKQLESKGYKIFATKGLGIRHYCAGTNIVGVS